MSYYANTREMDSDELLVEEIVGDWMTDEFKIWCILWH